MVGKDEELSIYDDDDVSPYLEGLEQEERRRTDQPRAGGEGAGDDAAPADPAAEPSDDAPAPQVNYKFL